MLTGLANLRTLDRESFTDAHASEEGHWLRHVVTAAFVRPEGTWHETALPCRRRLRSGKCRGRLTVLDEGQRGVSWRCTACDAAGTVVGIDDDIRHPRDGAEPIGPLRLALTRDLYEALLLAHIHGRTTWCVVASGLPEGERVELRTTEQGLEALCDELQRITRRPLDDPSPAAHRRRKRILRLADEALHAALRPRAIDPCTLSVAAARVPRKGPGPSDPPRGSMYLLVVDDRPAHAERIAAQGRRIGYSAFVLTAPAPLRETLARVRPHLVLVRAGLGGGRAQKVLREVALRADALTAAYVDGGHTGDPPPLAARRLHCLLREEHVAAYLDCEGWYAALSRLETPLRREIPHLEELPDPETLKEVGAMLGMSGPELEKHYVRSRLAPPRRTPHLLPGVAQHDVRDICDHDGYPRIEDPSTARLVHLASYVIQAATVRPAGRWWPIARRCPRRIGRVHCRGRIETLVTDVPFSLRWRCDGCGDQAMAIHADVTAWDRRDEPRPAGRTVRVAVPEPELTAICAQYWGDFPRILLAAEPTGGSVVLRGTADELWEVGTWEVGRSCARSPREESIVRRGLRRILAATPGRMTFSG